MHLDRENCVGRKDDIRSVDHKENVGGEVAMFALLSSVDTTTSRVMSGRLARESWPIEARPIIVGSEHTRTVVMFPDDHVG